MRGDPIRGAGQDRVEGVEQRQRIVGRGKGRQGAQRFEELPSAPVVATLLHLVQDGADD
jgi:hypothetical protein